MSNQMSNSIYPKPKISTSFDSELAEVLKTNENIQNIKRLDQFYGQVKRQLLRYQSPTTGLFPSLSCDLKEAHIRDSLYVCCAIWALYQAYSKRVDDDRGKGHELGQSTVKCMRGILFVWMRQSKDKVEPFKTNQNTKHALHSKVNLSTGLSLNDELYGHLQIDVVSLYLLFMVQMISSGLQLVYTMDEVQFVQNLVYYVERAYRTPDFGMWERGSKYNNGTPELNASSIGMAKSALEAINGCNLFGEKGASWSVIYVDIDAHSRNRSIFETLLPRESSSKNTDTSLLPTISWPCFATHDPLLYTATKDKVIKRLQTPYGFKRFLLDGFGTVFEKRDHLLRNSEAKQFENIECDWPIFCCFLIIDGVFKNNEEQVHHYQQFLFDKLLKKDFTTGDYLIPKYYYVPPEYIDAEKSDPGSTPRIASQEGSNSSVLYLMGQAVLIITQLLSEGLLQTNELDPIKRFMPSYDRSRKSGRYSVFQGTASDLVVQVVLIAESMRLQAMMATYGIQTQTPLEVEPVQIWPPSQLVKIYELLGINRKLGLKGRPARPIGALGTSKLYRICGQTVLCYPLIFEVSDFYLSYDMALLIDDIKNELNFVGKYWRMSGRPTVCILIREEHLRDINFKEMLDLLVEFKKGFLESGLKIKTGRLQNLISSSCFEHLDFLHLLPSEVLPKFETFRQLEHTIGIGYQSLTDIPKALVYNEEMDTDFKSIYEHRPTWPDIIDALKCCDTLHAQSQLLSILINREGLNYCLPDGMTVRDRLERLSRQAGALRHWSVVRHCASILRKLVDSISPYITSILVSGKQLTVGTYGQKEVVIDHPRTPKEIHQLLYDVITEPYDAVLQQEIILYVGRLISTTPHLFDGIVKIRVGSFVEAMKYYLSFKDEKHLKLESLAPSKVRRLLYKVLTDTDLGPREHRLIEGSLCRVPKKFYDKVWDILGRTPAGIYVGGQHLASGPTITLMTQHELNFLTKVESLLSHISAPDYRQIVIELLMIIHVILERNPELVFQDMTAVDLDKLISGAVNRYTTDRQEMVGIEAFYSEPKNETSGYMARIILDSLLRFSPPDCKIS